MAGCGRAGNVAGACCAAVPGAAFRKTCDPRSATGTFPSTGSTMSGSVWRPGCSPHESLPPYVLALGSQGAVPPDSRLEAEWCCEEFVGVGVGRMN